MDHNKNRALDWCVWKVAIPLVLLALFWPIYGFVLRLQHPFERAFAHGDLLIFSALILIEAAVEGEQVREESLRYRLGRQLAKGAAIILLFLFGFIKYDVILQEGLLASNGAEVSIIDKLGLYSYFNVLVAAAAALTSVYSFLKSVEAESKERLKSVGAFGG